MISFPPEKRKQSSLSEKELLKDTPETKRDVWFIVLSYIFVATIWIFGTDRLVRYLSSSLEETHLFSVVKGIGFVVITAILLFGLMVRLVSRWNHLNDSLRTSEEKHRLLIEHLPEGIFINRNDRVVFINPTAIRIFGGKKPEDFLLKPPLSLIHPDYHQQVQERIALLRQGNPVPPIVEKIVRLDGEVLEAEVLAVPFIEQGEPAIMVMLRDISDRVRKDAEIRRLNRLYSVLSQVNHAVSRVSSREELFHEVCWIIVGFGEFKMSWLGWINPATQEVEPVASAGHGVDFKNRRKHYAVDDLPEGRGITGTAIRENRSCFTNDYGSDPRTQPWHEAAASFDLHSGIALPISNGGKVCGALMAYAGEVNFFQKREINLLEEVARDISMALDRLDEESLRRKAEEALKKSEEKFSKAFNLTPAIITLSTLEDNRIIEANERFFEMLGFSREETIGRTIMELGTLPNPDDLERLVGKLMAEGCLRNEEYQIRTKGGELIYGLLSAELINVQEEPCVLCITSDITERKQMEEKFLRVQRMESIGALAGGMAHDLNNILAPIMMSASMLQQEQLPDDMRLQLACGIEEAAQRGADIVNQVLTFARGVKGEHTVINTMSLAAQMGKMVKETFPKSIAFGLFLPDSLWNITGDFTQLQQVFLNLFVNARDAMPEGGTLTLSVDDCEVDENFARVIPEARPGCYVRFEVQDSGTGIPKEILDRIFEPFFTTKEPGKGTGLGLSTAVGIIRSHGGFLKVTSEEGKGSIFQIFLPATQELSNEIVPPNQHSIPRGRGETILVVDDEPEILQIIETILVQNGWNVLCAADGEQGLCVFTQKSQEIKALVTDMVMPNMNGLNLIRAVRKMDKELPIIVSSGYSTEESRAELGELKVSAYLKKPFSARQLLATVASVFSA